MRKTIFLSLLALSLNGLAQTGLSVASLSAYTEPELPTGLVSGQIITTDHQPAAYVTVSLKGTSKFTTTDENGMFSIRVKEGVYTLEVSMVGLEPQAKTIDVKKDQTTSLRITLAENAKKTGRHRHHVAEHAKRKNRFHRKDSH